MADAANRGQRPAAAGTPSLLLRRIIAISLGLLLYSAASSFTPISWFTQSHWTTALDGPNIADRVLSPVLLLGAVVLHWYVASAVQPLPLTISVPNLGAIGEAGQQPQIPTDTIVLGLWLPGYFWGAMALEGAILWALRFSDFVVAEFARRSLLLGIVFSVWVVGWNALPWYRKQQAWGMMKDYMFRMVLMEMADAAFGGGRQRRRRSRM